MLVEDGTTSPYQSPAAYESLGRSALAHIWLVGSLALAGLVGGLVAGYVHPPTYSAQAQLIVGRTSGLVEDEVPGLQAAVQGLAQDYARLIDGSGVRSQTLANLRSTSLQGTLSASEVPLSSVIDVVAKASNEQQALRLAGAGAAALVTVVQNLTNDTPSQIQPILNEYKTADAQYEKAIAQVNSLQGQLNALQTKIGATTPTPVEDAEQAALNAEISDWKVQADTAQVQMQVYQNQYSSAVPPLAVQQEMVQQAGPATAGRSDRKTYMEIGGLGGAVGGLIVGLAGAAFIDTRRDKRRAGFERLDQ